MGFNLHGISSFLFAADLWVMFKRYGLVVDLYLEMKRLCNGLRFRFVRFKNVENIITLERHLNSIYIRKAKLNVYRARDRVGVSSAKKLGLQSNSIHPNILPVKDGKNDGRKYIDVVKGNKDQGDGLEAIDEQGVKLLVPVIQPDPLPERIRNLSLAMPEAHPDMGSAIDIVVSSSDASGNDISLSQINLVGTSNKESGLKGKGVQSRRIKFWKGKMRMRIIKEKARGKHWSKHVHKEGVDNRKKSSKKGHLIPTHSGDLGNCNQFSDSLSTHNSEKAKEVGLSSGITQKTLGAIPSKRH
ncbi:hypothetical protein L6452_02947 [Arctium lappa]|uniref:Uncharacterized protein n=1 Tax=Arctium lappa TaxID=4217 RepID=A0ACB9FKH5_ARCLA|nr:hypothetical protein L6452_02947 [Arctium lappa]